MLTDDVAWNAKVFGLVFDHAQRRVLLASADTLPHVEFPSDDFDLHLAVASLRDRCGRDVRTLRLLGDHRDAAARRLEVLLHCEDLGPIAGAYPDLYWAPAERIADLRTLAPTLRDAATAALAELDTAPAWRRPWERHGWHADPEAWMRKSAAAHGYIAAGPIDDFRTWSMTRMLRLPTDRGLLYFKTSGGSRLFAHEAHVTDGLAKRFPDHIPTPVAISRDENWMLTADFGEPIGHGCSLDQRVEALRQFASLQIETSRSIDSLLTLGCLDRRLPVLAKQIESLAYATSPPPGLEEADMIRLRAAQFELARLCAQLAEYRVPPTLVHGDLHMGNVALGPGKNGQRTFLFFDWTDACVAHPFLDLIALTGSLDAEAREAVVSAYLEPWTDFEPMSRLREMLGLALPLIALHQVISYRAIDEGSQELFMHGDTPAVAVWLRQALAAQPK